MLFLNYAHKVFAQELLYTRGITIFFSELIVMVSYLALQALLIATIYIFFSLRNVILCTRRLRIKKFYTNCRAFANYKSFVKLNTYNFPIRKYAVWEWNIPNTHSGNWMVRSQGIRTDKVGCWNPAVVLLLPEHWQWRKRHFLDFTSISLWFINVVVFFVISFKLSMLFQNKLTSSS